MGGGFHTPYEGCDDYEVGTASLKCAVPPPNDERNKIYTCPPQCTSINDGILSNQNVISTERFCFYECVPRGWISPSMD